jgi:hypothetical protein
MQQQKRAQLSRRTLLASTTGLLAATAGCLGVITGDGSYAASPATVADDAAADADYEHARTERSTVERTFSAADQERTVEVTNWMVEYHKTVSIGPLAERKAAVFGTFTSPNVSVLGQSFNPLSKLSTREIANRMQGQYEGLSVGDEIDSVEVQITGTATTVSTFEGTATFDGQAVDVFLVLNDPVKHEGDFVVCMAVYPQDMDGEHETVVGLMQSLEHPDDSATET